MSQKIDNQDEKPKLGLYLLPLVIFAVLMVFFVVGLGLNPRLVPSPLINQPVPKFSLPKLKQADEIFQQTELKGEVSLLNIWATWCSSCRQEHAVLMKIAQSKEVPIYGLFYKDDPTNGNIWLEDLGNPYRANAVDRDGRIGIEWGAYGTPETFVIDKKGIIRYKHIGPVRWQDWQTVLLPMIQQLRADDDT